MYKAVVKPMSKHSLHHSRPITHCQSCGEKGLVPHIFLGSVPLVNHMHPIGTIADAEMRFPLELVHCESCGLCQIGYEVDQQLLFPYSYPYLSGTTQILIDNFQDLAEEVSQLLPFQSGEKVIDIGANDGTLLKPFKEKGYSVLGVEPSQAARLAEKDGIPMMIDYFSMEAAQTIKQKHGLAKVITAANVFAHIKDVHEVIKGITSLLDEDGVFISESHYLVSLVETLQYDTIYHEHLRYYSLTALAHLFKKHGLEIFRAKKIPTHGGSIRVYAARKGKYPIDSSVHSLLSLEDIKGVSNGLLLKQFKEAVVKSKLDLLHIIRKIKAEGGTIMGIGAPSRASTLINYVGLDDGLLTAIGEVPNSHKLGKYIPGTRIPVVNERLLYENQPEFALLLSWHIAEELMLKLVEKGYQGDFIIPLPYPKIVTNKSIRAKKTEAILEQVQ